MFNFFRKILLKFFNCQIVYSQTGEDLILELITKNKKDGFYIDIGANHPKKFSNTYLLYRLGWRGINIEPNPKKAKMLKSVRSKDLNLEIGVGPVHEKKEFFVFCEDTLNTFDPIVADKYISLGHKLNCKKQIEVIPLKDVLEKYVGDKKIDLLSIDTEGYDIEILKSNDWNKWRPKLIIVETLEYDLDFRGKKLNEVFDPFMNSLGYEKIAETYTNTIYKDTR